MASLWMKVQQIPTQSPFQQQVQAVYSEPLFPIEVRYCLASWIDRQNWANLNPDNPFHEQTIKDLLSQFIHEIEVKAKAIQDPNAAVTKYKLTKAVEEYTKRFEINPVGLFRVIRNCLVNEMNIVQQFETTMNSPRILSCKDVWSQTQDRDPHRLSITQQLEKLRQEANGNAELVDKIIHENELFCQKYTKFQAVNERINPTTRQSVNGELQMSSMVVDESGDHRFLMTKLANQKAQLEYELREQLTKLDRMIVGTMERFRTNSDTIDTMISTVLDSELISWKRKQQLAGNGLDFNTGDLDALQNWCSDLIEIIWINLCKVKELHKNSQSVCAVSGDGVRIKAALEDLCRKFTAHLTTSVLNTFVLEKQPPQVMKTNTRFSAKIRFLVGNKLNIHLNPPQVKVSIISESQANILLAEKQFRGDVSGEILNNTGTMEYDNTNGQLSITFRNMQLKKIKRAEKKGSESVVDEKFALFFSAKFNIGTELDFGVRSISWQVWTMSLPVTVIVHGNQEPHAWATITWDNAFAEIARRPFLVPDKVPWGKVASALNTKFEAVTGRRLSEENKQYLAEKLFRCQYQNDDYDTMQVTWSQFSKESLADRTFTFWDWFYAIMKLTKEHLKPLWTEGLIHGFVRKTDLRSMMMNYPVGTFLLRFSDSELGGITIAWVDVPPAQPAPAPAPAPAAPVEVPTELPVDERNAVMQPLIPIEERKPQPYTPIEERRTIAMVQPFTAKDFAIRSLADRIKDLQHLLYLYPDRPKVEVFGHHYTPITETQTTSPNGYVKPLLVTTVPGVCWTVPNNVDHSGRMSGCNSYPTTPNIIQPISPSTNSSLSEPPGVSGWVETFAAMDYENMNQLEDFAADFSNVLHDSTMSSLQSRLSDAR